jgi:VWFA-related protein
MKTSGTSLRGGLTFYFLLIAALPAQTQTGEVTTRDEAPTFQSSVNLVRVPVVVRDKQGHTVGSFHKEDFQLTDRGKPQYVAQFAIEGSAVPKPAAQPRPRRRYRANPPRGLPSWWCPPASSPYVFDDVHLKLEDLMNARVAA